MSASASGAPGAILGEAQGGREGLQRPCDLRPRGDQAGHHDRHRVRAQQGEEHPPGRAEGRLLSDGQPVQDRDTRGVHQLEPAVCEAQ